MRRLARLLIYFGASMGGPSVPSTALLDEDGAALLDEDGGYLLEE